MELRSEKLADVEVLLDAPIDVGAVPAGTRRVFQVTGGTVRGSLSGEVLAGGAEGLLVRTDGAVVLDVCANLRLDDGALVSMHSSGILEAPPPVLQRMVAGDLPPPSEYYFRSTPSLETAAPAYAWLNRVLCVALMRRTRTGVVYSLHRIL